MAIDVHSPPSRCSCDTPGTPAIYADVLRKRLPYHSMNTLNGATLSLLKEVVGQIRHPIGSYLRLKYRKKLQPSAYTDT